MIMENEPYQGYWEFSENNIINKVNDQIAKLTRTVPFSFLDAGCGNGRLTLEFAPSFDVITAIEPDSERLHQAQNLIAKSNLAGKITFNQQLIQEINEDQRKFDVILLSHVLQHVPIDSLAGIFKKLRKLLKDNGLIIITTCHSHIEQDFYTYSYLKDDQFYETKSDENTFNTYTTNTQKVLPAHFFTKKSLESLLSTQNLGIVEFYVYHILDKNIPGIDDSKVNRDDYVNSISALQARKGRDMLVIIKKQVNDHAE